MTKFHNVLQSSAWLAWLIVFGSVAGLVTMILDDKPPFRVLGYGATSPRPGEVLRVTTLVERDLRRGCSVTFSRHVIDGAGTRLDLQPSTAMTAEALASLEAAAPGRLLLAVPIPPYAVPGPAKLVIPLHYTCNVWQAMRPIEATMVIPFEIAPAAPAGGKHGP